ncbi:MAG: LysR substrate-binding domain-containing protein [Pseudomonadota bacterium]
MRVDLRDLQLFAALAQHEHFTRAAEACGISQPALSLRLTNLEATLGTQLVRRGARFAGFTEEGEILLGWARRILAEHDAMLGEISGGRGEVVGHVTLGVIPTALAFAARVAVAVRARHPRLVPVIRSASATEITAGLAAGRFDIGLSYLAGERIGDGEAPLAGSSKPPRALYREQYVLVATQALVTARRETISWAEAATLPMAALTPDMKNRRIIDAAFREAGASPNVVFETNDLSTLFAIVADGSAATVMPANAASDIAALGRRPLRLTLTAPDLRRTVAAFLPVAGFEAPAVGAVLRVAEEVAARVTQQLDPEAEDRAAATADTPAHLFQSETDKLG